MNKSETLDWVTHHGIMFPDFAAWLSTTPAASRSKLLDAWSEALADVDPRDAKAVTSRMLSGDDPPIAAYEREQTPAKVRTLAKANRDRRYERDRKTKQRGQDEAVPLRGGISTGGLYRSMLKLMDANPDMTAREAAEQVIPPARNDGPRFNCPLCLDSGLVTVWSSISVRAALHGELDKPEKRRTCACPCKCQEGSKRIWSGNGDPPAAWRGWRSTEAMYCPTVHCIAHGGDTDSQRAVEAFKEWVILANEAYQNRNRTAAFDDFNNQPREF